MTKKSKMRHSERGAMSASTMVFGAFTLAVAVMATAKFADLRKAKRNEVQNDTNRRVNEAALQIVTQLVANGLIFYDPNQCGGILRPQSNFSDSGTGSASFSCGATGSVMTAAQCDSASDNGWAYRNTGEKAVVDVCVPVSDKSTTSGSAGGGMVNKKIPVSVTFLSYRGEKFSRNTTVVDKTTVESAPTATEQVTRYLGSVRAQRISSDKKYPTLDGEVNLGAVEDANGGLMGKHGAADACFFMRPRTADQGVVASYDDAGGVRRRYLGFANRESVADATYKSYSYSDVEPRPDGKLADQFGRDYDWDDITTGAARADGSKPTKGELSPFFSHLRDFGEKLLAQYSAGNRIGRLIGKNLGLTSVSAPLDIKTAEVNGQLAVTHADYIDAGKTYRKYFAGVMPQYNDGEGPTFKWFLHKNHDTKSKTWPTRADFDATEKDGMKGGCKTSGHDDGGRYDFCTRVDIPHQRHDVKLRKKCSDPIPVTLTVGSPTQYSNRAVNVSCTASWVAAVGQVYRDSVNATVTGNEGDYVLAGQGGASYNYSGSLDKSKLKYEVNIDQLVSALEVD
ncbi:MAG: hypothetical protein RIR26_923, partial [Pseudomonadota bacterium]